MREACGEAHMKTILATGECGSLVNVYKASLVCMMAGRQIQGHEHDPETALFHLFLTNGVI